MRPLLALFLARDDGVLEPSPPPPATPAPPRPRPPRRPRRRPASPPACRVAVGITGAFRIGVAGAIGVCRRGRQPELPTTDPAVHVFLWGNAGTTARDLHLASDGGFHWVKQRFEWRNIEGKDKGSFEWNEPDRIVDAIAQRGPQSRRPRRQSAAVGIVDSVQWPGTGPPDNPNDWTDYLTALATRYKGRIQAYEIWNEPNLDREWGDKQPDPAAYAAMLKASYAGDQGGRSASAGHLGGHVADDGQRSHRRCPTCSSSAQMYAAGARDSFDILGVHAAGLQSRAVRRSSRGRRTARS